MEITEVRIKLMSDDQDRLLGFCSITIDGAFVVRDLKIIRGTHGSFVAMPSRKLSDRCSDCGGKNHLRAVFCSQCGVRLEDDRSAKASDGKAKLYADIAHPINSQCRDLIQEHVLRAYDDEVVLAKSPDYVCRYDEFGESDYDEFEHRSPASLSTHKGLRVDSPAPEVPSKPHPQREQRTILHREAEEFGDGIL